MLEFQPLSPVFGFSEIPILYTIIGSRTTTSRRSIALRVGARSPSALPVPGVVGSIQLYIYDTALLLCDIVIDFYKIKSLKRQSLVLIEAINCVRYRTADLAADNNCPSPWSVVLWTLEVSCQTAVWSGLTSVDSASAHRITQRAYSCMSIPCT